MIPEMLDAVLDRLILRMKAGHYARSKPSEVFFRALDNPTDTDPLILNVHGTDRIRLSFWGDGQEFKINHLPTTTADKARTLILMVQNDTILSFLERAYAKAAP